MTATCRTERGVRNHDIDVSVVVEIRDSDRARLRVRVEGLVNEQTQLSRVHDPVLAIGHAAGGLDGVQRVATGARLGGAGFTRVPLRSRDGSVAAAAGRQQNNGSHSEAHRHGARLAENPAPSPSRLLARPRQSVC